MRAAGLIKRLTQLGVNIHDFGDVPVAITSGGGVPVLRGTEVLGARARNTVQLALDAELFPLLLGGEHCAALGTIAGAAKAYPNLGIVWIDAHPDFNTPETSLTGNPHGMVLALSAGLGPLEALKRLGRIPLVAPRRIGILGARSIDPAERELLAQEGVRFWTTGDLLRDGPAEAANRAASYLNASGAEAIHVSVDLDVLDPSGWPGVSTPVGEGISLNNLLALVTAMIQELNVVSLDIVELNPPCDLDGRTAEAAVQVAETVTKALLKRG